MQTSKKGTSAYEILRYIRGAFDDEEVLDSVPLAAAGNPGAWHAWRTHRRAAGKLAGDSAPVGDSQAHDGEDVRSAEGSPGSTKPAQPAGAPRQPGEWNWDGVWEDRVKKGIAASLSEPVLYGAATTPDDLVSHVSHISQRRASNNPKIRFLAMEDNDVDSVKENLRRTLGSTA